MRPWLLLPIVALVACMDTSKDDDDDDDDENEEDGSGLDDFGGGVGGGTGGDGGSGGDGDGDGSGGEGSGSGGEGSDSGGEGSGSGGDYDGTYDILMFHTVIVPGLELPCGTDATVVISDGELDGEARCDDEVFAWDITWAGEVDAVGNISGEAAIDITTIGVSVTAPLEGHTDGSTIVGEFEGEDRDVEHYGEFFGDRAR